jgi:hypothetical protein
MAQKANRLARGVQPSILDALAMADAELGQFAEAQKIAQTAVNIAAADGATNDVAAIGRRLELYKNGKPFRQTFADAGAGELPAK